MTTVPTVVVHGGAGTYARIIIEHEKKEDTENGMIVVVSWFADCEGRKHWQIKPLDQQLYESSARFLNIER